MISFRMQRRFWAKVCMGKTLNDCWEWTASTNQAGYGRLKVSGRLVQAHRMAYAMYKRDPAGKLVMHTCDNPLCVNPRHLFLGTHGDNANDRSRKDRGCRLSGALNGMARLTAPQVHRIRLEAAAGKSYNQLGREFGVSGVQISNIVRRKHWRRAA